MSNRKSIRLIDLMLLVPSDIKRGFAKCKSGKTIEFTDISHIKTQYQLDTVECFDIDSVEAFGVKANYIGERGLFVWLAHN